MAADADAGLAFLAPAKTTPPIDVTTVLGDVFTELEVVIPVPELNLQEMLWRAREPTVPEVFATLPSMQFLSQMRQALVVHPGRQEVINALSADFANISNIDEVEITVEAF